MSAAISAPCAQRLASICEERYQELLGDGCDEDVAADRVMDVLTCALERTGTHCFDTRDRLFENRLRTEVRRG